MKFHYKEDAIIMAISIITILVVFGVMILITLKS